MVPGVGVWVDQCNAMTSSDTDEPSVPDRAPFLPCCRTFKRRHVLDCRNGNCPVRADAEESRNRLQNLLKKNRFWVLSGAPEGLVVKHPGSRPKAEDGESLLEEKEEEGLFDAEKQEAAKAGGLMVIPGVGVWVNQGNAMTSSDTDEPVAPDRPPQSPFLPCRRTFRRPPLHAFVCQNPAAEESRNRHQNLLRKNRFWVVSEGPKARGPVVINPDLGAGAKEDEPDKVLLNEMQTASQKLGKERDKQRGEKQRGLASGSGIKDANYRAKADMQKHHEQTDKHSGLCDRCSSTKEEVGTRGKCNRIPRTVHGSSIAISASISARQEGAVLQFSPSPCEEKNFPGDDAEGVGAKVDEDDDDGSSLGPRLRTKGRAASGDTARQPSRRRRPSRHAAAEEAMLDRAILIANAEKAEIARQEQQEQRRAKEQEQERRAKERAAPTEGSSRSISRFFDGPPVVLVDGPPFPRLNKIKKSLINSLSAALEGAAGTSVPTPRGGVRGAGTPSLSHKPKPMDKKRSAMEKKRRARARAREDRSAELRRAANEKIFCDKCDIYHRRNESCEGEMFSETDSSEDDAENRDEWHSLLRNGFTFEKPAVATAVNGSPQSRTTSKIFYVRLLVHLYFFSSEGLGATALANRSDSEPLYEWKRSGGFNPKCSCKVVNARWAFRLLRLEPFDYIESKTSPEIQNRFEGKDPKCQRGSPNCSGRVTVVPGGHKKQEESVLASIREHFGHTGELLTTFHPHNSFELREYIIAEKLLEPGSDLLDDAEKKVLRALLDSDLDSDSECDSDSEVKFRDAIHAAHRDVRLALEVLRLPTARETPNEELNKKAREQESRYDLPGLPEPASTDGEPLRRLLSTAVGIRLAY